MKNNTALGAFTEAYKNRLSGYSLQKSCYQLTKVALLNLVNKPISPYGIKPTTKP